MRRLAVALSLSFLLPVVSEAVAQGGDPCFEGAFEAPFPHENLDNQFTWPATFWSNPAPAQKSPFNALHLTLIPKGPYRGRVLAWTYNFEPTVSAPIPSLHLTRWSIIQPELPNGIPSNNKFWNFELPHGEKMATSAAPSAHGPRTDGTSWPAGRPSTIHWLGPSSCTCSILGSFPRRRFPKVRTCGSGS